METVTLAHKAMGTRFEIVLHGARRDYLFGVAEEVFREISRLDAKLSYYRVTSDINDINLHAGAAPVYVDPPLFALLKQAKELSEVAEGAFDLTIAPLLECWGFVGGEGRLPNAEEIAAAMECVGMHHLLLDERAGTVAFDRPGVRLDLGAIGKGYAIDVAAEMLRDYEVESALLHGGTSSICALGTPPDAEAWNVALQEPFESGEGRTVAQVALHDETISVSAPRNKGFNLGGKRYGHVLDPRTGSPSTSHLLAAVIHPSATVGDALSTALLVRGAEWLETLRGVLGTGEALFALEGEPNQITFFMTDEARFRRS